MTAHKHAELMAQYAQDAMGTNTPWELWEWRRANSNELWDELETNPTWCEYNEYRRKPRTININGHEVPEPTRTPLEEETKYYIPDFSEYSLACHFYWANDEFDRHCLVAGLIHRTKEDAIAHAKALLSFTAKPEHTPGPWHIQQGDDSETFIKPIPGQVVAVIEPQADKAEEAANARLIAASPDMHALLLQIHTELSHITRADADPANWEGHTMHRIEKLLWPENAGGNHETG